MRIALRVAAVAIAMLLTVPASAQVVGRQTQSDDYTRYELLAPETAQFRIVYEVTATTPGATVFFNVIRKGSEASDEAVYDRMTGERLKFEVVSGAEAREAGLSGADVDTSYIKVLLPRAVPQNGGEVRLRIEETYTDPARYRLDGQDLVWDRSLGRPYNAVVLPLGWYLTASSIPALVWQQEDGCIRLEYVNARPDEVNVLLRARRRR